MSSFWQYCKDKFHEQIGNQWALVKENFNKLSLVSKMASVLMIIITLYIVFLCISTNILPVLILGILAIAMTCLCIYHIFAYPINMENWFSITINTILVISGIVYTYFYLSQALLILIFIIVIYLLLKKSV